MPQIQIELELDYELSVDFPKGVGREHEQSIDKPGDTVIIDLSQNSQLFTSKATPEATSQAELSTFPEPQIRTSSLLNTLAQAIEPPNTREERERREYLDLRAFAARPIVRDVNEGNIVLGKRAQESRIHDPNRINQWRNLLLRRVYDCNKGQKLTTLPNNVTSSSENLVRDTTSFLLRRLQGSRREGV